MKRGRYARVSGGVGKGLLWLLVLGVVAAAAFVVLSPQPAVPEEDPNLAVAIPTPPPATPAPALATPAPVVVQSTAVPEPVAAVATPPPPLDAATVSRTPALWPGQVALIQKHNFPVLINGQKAGDAQAAVGTILRVLRVGPQHVEVEFQSAKHVLPMASTDLMARAAAIHRKNGSILPVTAVSTVPAVASAPLATVPPARTVGAPIPNPVRLNERMIVEVTRNKRSRVEGGDWDDKKDRIELKVKLSNSDPQMTMSGLKGEIFVFAESILDRSAVKLLNSQTFDFSLQPRANFEFMTNMVETAYDTTGARFGHKYEGWVLRLRDSAGAIVVAKATSPNLLKLVEQAGGLSVNSSYDRMRFTSKADH